MTSHIRLSFDGGWSDGDPGDGRLRFDSPRLSDAAHVYINARDAQEAMLDEYVPTWRLGDVLVIERAGIEVNRVVAWIIGPVRNRGSYWKVPVAVRTVHGSIAQHDELRVCHHATKAEVINHEPAAVPGATVVPLKSEPAPALPAPPADMTHELEQLRADNAGLLAVLEKMVSDETPLYTVDNQ